MWLRWRVRDFQVKGAYSARATRTLLESCADCWTGEPDERQEQTRGAADASSGVGGGGNGGNTTGRRPFSAITLVFSTLLLLLAIRRISLP